MQDPGTPPPRIAIPVVALVVACLALPAAGRGQDAGCRYHLSNSQVVHYTPDLAPKDQELTAEQRREWVRVSPIFFPEEPQVGTWALVLPYPSGPAVRLRIEEATVDPEAPPPPQWVVRLEEATATPLKDVKSSDPNRRPEYPTAAVVLWPAPEEGRIVDAEGQELPPDVVAAIVEAAVDLDGDGAADLLVVEHCCGDRSRRKGCDYHCGETWQRIDGRWQRCSAWQPA